MIIRYLVLSNAMALRWSDLYIHRCSAGSEVASLLTCRQQLAQLPSRVPVAHLAPRCQRPHHPLGVRNPNLRLLAKNEQSGCSAVALMAAATVRNPEPVRTKDSDADLSVQLVQAQQTISQLVTCIAQLEQRIARMEQTNYNLGGVSPGGLQASNSAATSLSLSPIPLR
jgi:hypothetical protein